jgi:cyclopropane fatty-acyl-phospholipid synthase-like methyltransferase
MRKTRSLDVDYFETLYQSDPDPWNFTTSAYEAEKYEHTVRALGEERAARALEIGCSIGVLTQALAPLCDRLVATELSASALAQARERCQALAHVEFRLAKTPTEPVEGPFDLIVISEVAYYWDDHDLARMAQMIAHILAPGGRVLLVHWLGETDYPKSADEAVDTLAAHLASLITVEKQKRRAKYRLDLWRRAA